MSDRPSASSTRPMLPRLRLPVAAALCAAMALPASAIRAQSSERRPGAWIAAVRAHQPGRGDAPLAAIAAWTSDEIARVLPAAGGEPDAARVLAKALVLHTDIAILQRSRSLGGLRATTLEDGRAAGSRLLSSQWKIGRMIAAFLVELPVKARTGEEAPDRARVERERLERRSIARRWYGASTALLQDWTDLGFAQTNADAGLDLLDDDPVLLLYRATLHQAYADPRVQQFVRGIASLQAGPSQPQRLEIELRLAASDLRRALDVDPQLVEARIRLAHVLAAQGRHEDAAALIRPAMASPLPPFLDYYGSLVLGRAEERLGRLPEAQAAFERAARGFPDAQAARVALSRLSLIQGRAGDGLAAVVDASRAGASEEAADPWWSYFRRHEPDSASLLAELRASAR